MSFLLYSCQEKKEKITTNKEELIANIKELSSDSYEVVDFQNKEITKHKNI